MSKVAVIGEGVIDRFINGDSHTDVIGGSGLNTAVAMKRAGVDAVWFTRLASDTNGIKLSQYARTEGVLADSPIEGLEAASLVKVILQSDGQPTYEFSLEGAVDWNWSESELNQLSNQFAVVQIGSLSAVLDPGADLLRSAVSQLKSGSNPPLITYDPNARPSAAQNGSQAELMRTRIQNMVELADLVKVSDEDLVWLKPGMDPIESARQWSNEGPQLVVLTRGSKGSKAFRHGQEISSIDGEKIDVVDTVGAGDTFMAWLVALIVLKFSCAIPTSSEKITSLLSTASKAAAITCSREGCKPPYANELN